MAIQIGFNGRFFPENWRPLQQEVTFAHQQGFAYIQFALRDDYLRESTLKAHFDTASTLLQQANLQAVMEIMVTVDAQGHPTTGGTLLDSLKDNLPAITRLPCTHVHWHLVPATPLDEGGLDQLEQQLTPVFQQAVELADKHHFQFGFEHNAPQIGLFGTPTRCATLLEAVLGLNFVWDFNHTLPEHIIEFQALIPRTSHLHISDSPLPHVNHHLPLGQGNIDLAAYCTALFEAGFKGPGILEIGGNPASGGFGKDSDQALAQSYHHLDQLINALN